MPSNVCVGIVVDVGFEKNEMGMFYKKILPQIVLKIMFHHKFYDYDDNMTLNGNNLYWNYVILKENSLKKYYNRNKFMEFTKTTFDEFILNYNKMEIKDEHLVKNSQSIIKMIIDHITVNFDWNMGILVSPSTEISNKGSLKNGTSKVM